MQDAQDPKACALTYDGSGVPRLTAKGEGDIAQQIIEIAEQHWIPLFENPLLVDLLSQLELQQEIPENLYKAVAHILSFAYSLENCGKLNE